MILRYTGLAVTAIAAFIAVVAFRSEVSFVSATSALTSILAVIFYQLSIFKKDKKTPLITVSHRDFSDLYREMSPHKDYMSVAANFEILNHGSTVTEVEIISAPFPRFSYDFMPVMKPGDRFDFDVSPAPNDGNKISFKLKCKNEDGVHNLKFYIYGGTFDVRSAG